jgi:hypothetical protein
MMTWQFAGFALLVAVMILVVLLRLAWRRRIREYRRATGQDLQTALADYLKGIPTNKR